MFFTFLSKLVNSGTDTIRSKSSPQHQREKKTYKIQISSHKMNKWHTELANLPLTGGNSVTNLPALN